MLSRNVEVGSPVVLDPRCPNVLDVLRPVVLVFPRFGAELVGLSVFAFNSAHSLECKVRSVLNLFLNTVLYNVEASEVYQEDTEHMISLLYRGSAMMTVVPLKCYLLCAVPPRVRVC